MDIPKTITHKLCDAERFIIGLKLLGEECNLTSVTYNAFGVIQYHFRDGSYVGSRRAEEDAGFIKK